MLGTVKSRGGEEIRYVREYEVIVGNQEKPSQACLLGFFLASLCLQR